MDIKELKTEFIICDVPGHFKHKAILLDLINKMPDNPDGTISKTDYTLPLTFEKEYLQYFHSHIAKHIMDPQLKYFKAKSWKIGRAWFQQYQKGSSHCDHTHPGANLTSVYFLELPDPQFKTSIKIGEKEYDYEVKEGQSITFPAHLLHYAKSNGNLRKTIISFNSDFYFT